MKAEAIYISPEGLPQVLTSLRAHPLIPCFVFGTRISDGVLLSMTRAELKPVGYRTTMVTVPVPILIAEEIAA